MTGFAVVCTLLGDGDFVAMDYGTNATSAIDRTIAHYDRMVPTDYPIGKSRLAKWRWLKRHRGMRLTRFKPTWV